VRSVTLRYTFSLLGVLVLLAAAGGCKNSPTSPSTTPTYSQTDLTLGTGTQATTGSTVTVDYTGWLYDPSKADQKGPIFDTSLGRDPLSFALGTGYVIAGWDRGLVGMQVGGVRRLVIPPSLAYGGTRVSAVPPNATLIFEVTLTAVE
jgi:FKBP-type peptidyl-prolyl cis-trans isomerase FkpA